MSDDGRDGLELGPDFTFAYSRISCVSWIYPLHILSAYLLVAFGIGALVCRVWERYKSWHGFFGRCFMVTMYWGYGTSLLIHRFGLPYAIIIFMTTKLICMGIGFFAIRRYVRINESKVLKRVFAMLKTSQAEGRTPDEVAAQARRELDSEKTTFASRFFTLKSLHGVTMTYAWYTMLGRTMVTNPVEAWSGCSTYPAVKSLEGPIEYVPREDPKNNGFNFEMAFGFGLFTAGLTLITIIGATYSYFASKKAAQRAQDHGNLNAPLQNAVSHEKSYDSVSSSSVSDEHQPYHDRA